MRKKRSNCRWMKKKKNRTRTTRMDRTFKMKIKRRSKTLLSKYKKENKIMKFNNSKILTKIIRVKTTTRTKT